MMSTKSALGALAIAAALGACDRKPAVAPIELTPEQKAGALTYARTCAQCHSGGMGVMGPSLRYTKMDDAAIRARVREGRNLMPAFGPDRLADKELDDLLAYLKTLRRQAAP